MPLLPFALPTSYPRIIVHIVAEHSLATLGGADALRVLLGSRCVGCRYGLAVLGKPSLARLLHKAVVWNESVSLGEWSMLGIWCVIGF